MQAYPTSAQAKPDGGAARRAASAQQPSDEPTLDQLLAEPIVQQLMRSDRTDEAAIRQLVRKTAAVRLALQAYPRSVSSGGVSRFNTDDMRSKSSASRAISFGRRMH